MLNKDGTVGATIAPNGEWIVRQVATVKKTVYWSQNITPTGPAKRGDVAWNNKPIAGQNVGWVCVADGNPGTWETFGFIGVGARPGAGFGVNTGSQSRASFDTPTITLPLLASVVNALIVDLQRVGVIN